MNIKTRIASLFILAAFIPAAASALSVAEIQAQIQSLLARVNELRAQLQTAQSPSETMPIGTMPIETSRPRVCDFIERRLSPGNSGDEVRALQEFLRGEGVFNREPTGYFGAVTGDALRSWQVREGIVSSASSGGVFGERSREFLMRRCGGGGGSAVFNASPRAGAAPLTVTFYTNVGGLRPFSTRYEIDFGDGTKAPAPDCLAPADACVRPGEITHTYATNGNYTATLTRISNPCDGNPLCMAPVSVEVLGKIEVAVGAVACTLEYAPVCGAKPVVCITTPCNPVPTTYGNRCAMNADGARLLYEGECRSDVVHPEKDPQCKRWNDGYYCGQTCYRDTVGGAPKCMIPMCAAIDVNAMPAPTSPRCLEYFSSANKPPTISGFSGPTTLRVNEVGTWTVSASDTENQNLSYSVDWGEIFAGMGAASLVSPERVFTQTTTFTHSYAFAGTYTVGVTVRDAAGQTARTTITVRIGSSGLSCVSGGATYPEGTRQTCITQNGNTSCIADAAYVCKSGTWTIEGTYPPPLSCISGGTSYPEGSRLGCVTQNGNTSCLGDAMHICRSGAWTIESTYPPVACTMDAMMCPDGTYVGRTGPNCQFVCPGTR